MPVSTYRYEPKYMPPEWSAEPTKIIDPLKLIEILWPGIRLYDKQVEILYSLNENDETVVPAGNMLGKDFIAALAILIFFLSRYQARVVASSVDQDQLSKVLWGEMANFIQSAAHPLPLKVNFLNITKEIDGVVVPKTYIVGRVAKTPEGLLGHHLDKLPGNVPTTLAVFDEASSIKDVMKEKTDTWAHRTLVIGNPYPCNNFFKQASKLGDVPRENGRGCYTKIIRITGHDSPNVKAGKAEEAAGREPSGNNVLPGVLPYYEYVKRLKTWSEQRIAVSINAIFYEGVSELLFPMLWLDAAEKAVVDPILRRKSRKYLGVDSAAGGDDTVHCVMDQYGIVKMRAKKTPDTTEVNGTTLALQKEFNIADEDIMYDQGGGGKEHVDRLREQGHKGVRTIAFGAAPNVIEPDQTFTEHGEIVDQREIRYTYKNMRAQMYGEFSIALDFTSPLHTPFHLPSEYAELRRQLEPIPRIEGKEGELLLPPKDGGGQDIETMRSLIGCSPDWADAAVVAYHCMTHKVKKVRVGGLRI